MPRTADLIQVAKVLKSNGTDGEVLLGFRSIDPETVNLEEPVYILRDGLPVPFFISSLTLRGTSRALVHLTDICSLADAEELIGADVLADPATLLSDEGDGDPFADPDALPLDLLIGWSLYDAARLVGTVTGYEDIPGNPCLYVSPVTGHTLQDTPAPSSQETRGNALRQQGRPAAASFPSAADAPSSQKNAHQGRSAATYQQDGEVLVPLHPDLIVDVNPEARTLTMRLPEGLV